MARIETWYEQDLQKPVRVHNFKGSFFSGDASANRVGVVVTNNGAAVTLSGSATGYFMLANGTTATVAAAITGGNKVYVNVPATAYSVPGPITVTIRLTDGSVVTTLLACVGIVVLSRTDVQPASPGAITDWTNQISSALQEVTTIADNVGRSIAEDYDSLLQPIEVGTYAMHNGLLYCCETRITDDATFVVGHWRQCNAMGELTQDVSDLNRDLNELATYAYVPVNYVLKPNTYIDRSGNDYHYNGWTATNHIPVTAGEKIYLYNAKLTEYCAFYKDDNTLLTRATVGVGEPFVLNVPSGAYYFAYSNETADMFTHIYRDAGIASFFASADSVDEISEAVNGNVSYELEQGNIHITDHGWYYSDMSTRIRVREGTYINLPKGTVITLADFASYHMYIGWMKDGTYGYSGWMENTFVCPETAAYTLIVVKKPETDISVNEAQQQLSIYAYNSLVYDKYENSLKGLWKNEWLYDIAHRGYVRGGAPADTAPAYIQAKVQGYNAIEGDIRVTSDGKYVIHHDDDMPSDSTYKISEHTLAELRANANMGTYKGQAVPILTLREMLVIAKNIDVTVFLELKSDLTNSQIVEVMTIARDCGMQDRIRWIAKTSNASVFRGFYSLCYLAISNTLDYTLIQPLVISGHPERTFVYTMSTNITDTFVKNCANVGLCVVGWCVSYDWMFPDGWTDASVKAEIVRALDCGAQGMALDWWTVSKIIAETYQAFI